MKLGGLWFLAVCVAFVSSGCGEHEGPGTIEGARVPVAVVAEREEVERQAGNRLALEAQSAVPGKRILFGDLHVHTTFSADAFYMSLPFNREGGARPLAEACDFARYCSALDFWSINDHAEALSPRRWEETKEAVRQCNAVSEDPSNPDVVTFLGWEWTQIGDTPANHFGHKNVILRDTAEADVPTRPISSAGGAGKAMRARPSLWQQVSIPLLDPLNLQRYLNFSLYQRSILDAPECPKGVDVRDLPEDCLETAPTPRELFAKLDQWGFDAMVIPHGAAWGMYTPPGVDYRKHLNPDNRDPKRQRLIEIYSGHGNSEEYRQWRALDYDAQGKTVCPEPTADYEPCCWRAGELIRDRCEEPGSAACAAKVEAARANYLQAGATGRLTVPGASVEDWKDCGECRDCYQPAYRYRPGNAVQLAVAAGEFSDPEQPQHMTLGFIASSDNHSAKPGTGYKEFARREMTESIGPSSETWRKRIFHDREATPNSLTPELAVEGILPVQTLDFERGSSFFYTGGLVAVHAAGRDRDAIWEALDSREVYATSGERIMLWFDLVTEAQGVKPMGSELSLSETPRFQVRALGSPVQAPGCPDHALRGLSEQRLEKICGGECYHPTDKRKRITRIEVVRIRRQVSPDEPIESLIDDPWKVLPCPAGGSGCVQEFIDPDFLSGDRAVLYYARAIEEAAPAVNADGLRCRERSADGTCLKVDPCYGDSRTDKDDDCLGQSEARAWSSPIYLNPQ